eukprot:1657649-Amphidinium_carterae.1
MHKNTAYKPLYTTQQQDTVNTDSRVMSASGKSLGVVDFRGQWKIPQPKEEKHTNTLWRKAESRNRRL